MATEFEFRIIVRDIADYGEAGRKDIQKSLLNGLRNTARWHLAQQGLEFCFEPVRAEEIEPSKEGNKP